jgi:hypothetical protein
MTETAFWKRSAAALLAELGTPDGGLTAAVVEPPHAHQQCNGMPPPSVLDTASRPVLLSFAAASLLERGRLWLFVVADHRLSSP